mmetsp:Transcript_15950/g.41104  ORF Transcript_15950/g.41104 Transcript_15950/m.41104 type:complete len:207 (+) Transcript_15950:700-1320(+)
MPRRTRSTSSAATCRSTWSCSRRRILSATSPSSPGTSRRRLSLTASRTSTRRFTRRSARTPSSRQPRRRTTRARTSAGRPSSPTRSAMPRLRQRRRRCAWRSRRMTTTTTTMRTTSRLLAYLRRPRARVACQGERSVGGPSTSTQLRDLAGAVRSHTQRSDVLCLGCGSHAPCVWRHVGLRVVSVWKKPNVSQATCESRCGEYSRP